MPPQTEIANGKLVSSDGEDSDSDESITEGGADEDLSKVVAGPSDACKLVRSTAAHRTLMTVGPRRQDRPRHVERQDRSAVLVRLACHLLSLIERRHATLSCYKAVSRANPALLRAWEREGCAGAD